MTTTTHHLGCDVRKGRCAEETQVHLHLVLEDLDRSNDSLVAVGRVCIYDQSLTVQYDSLARRDCSISAAFPGQNERTKEWPTDADRLGAERHRLDDVAGSPHATVNAMSQ